MQNVLVYELDNTAADLDIFDISLTVEFLMEKMVKLKGFEAYPTNYEMRYYNLTNERIFVIKSEEEKLFKNIDSDNTDRPFVQDLTWAFPELRRGDQLSIRVVFPEVVLEC